MAFSIEKDFKFFTIWFFAFCLSIIWHLILSTSFAFTMYSHNLIVITLWFYTKQLIFTWFLVWWTLPTMTVLTDPLIIGTCRCIAFCWIIWIPSLIIFTKPTHSIISYRFFKNPLIFKLAFCKFTLLVILGAITNLIVWACFTVNFFLIFSKYCFLIDIAYLFYALCWIIWVLKLIFWAWFTFCIFSYLLISQATFLFAADLLWIKVRYFIITT